VRYVIIGCGNVGMELARRWTFAGHHVTGTTTSAGRVDELKAVCADVAILRGGDSTAVRDATCDADAVVLTVSPRVARSFDANGRIAEYADTLTATARTAAAVHPRVVFTSSTSVYGSGDGRPLDESSPTTDDPDASPRNFVAAEDAVLATPRGAVVRIPDVYGHPRDIDYVTRVRLVHEMLGGSVPFAADALLYRVDYRDAAAALDFVVSHDLVGVFNAVPDATVPPTNGEVFGRICTEQGWPELSYRAEIKTPSVPVSSARLRAEGFGFAH
jgi:nucleoside-diphosphate-sugar epimerase